jgi:hypothetical protein
MSVHTVYVIERMGLLKQGRNVKQARGLLYVVYIAKWNYGTP